MIKGSTAAAFLILFSLLMGCFRKREFDFSRTVVGVSKRDDTLVLVIERDSTMNVRFGDSTWCFFGHGRMSDSQNGVAQCIEFSVQKSTYCGLPGKEKIGLIEYDTLPSSLKLNAFYLLYGADTVRLDSSPFIGRETEVDLSGVDSYDIRGEIVLDGRGFPFQSNISRVTSSGAASLTKSVTLQDSVIFVQDQFKSDEFRRIE